MNTTETSKTSPYCKSASVEWSLTHSVIGLMELNNLSMHATLDRPPRPVYLTPDYAYIVFIPYMMYPVSRGRIHITSADIYTGPELSPGYLSNPLDLPPHVLAYKQQREIARRMPSFRGEASETHPPFSETSAARCIEFPTTEQRAEIVKTKIIYTEEDNKIIEAWVGKTIFPVWHWLGTTAMKPRENGGVVDRHLGVHGLKGLKIAGTSKILSSAVIEPCVGYLIKKKKRGGGGEYLFSPLGEL